MLKYNALDIWSQTPLDIKNKPCLELLQPAMKRYPGTKNIVGVLPFLICVHYTSTLILHCCYYVKI